MRKKEKFEVYTHGHTDRQADRQLEIQTGIRLEQRGCKMRVQKSAVQIVLGGFIAFIGQADCETNSDTEVYEFDIKSLLGDAICR